jgi:hypothetical protein
VYHWGASFCGVLIPLQLQPYHRGCTPVNSLLTSTSPELLSEWSNYPHLFPRLPERSRFNRRRRNLMHVINLMRQLVLKMLDVAQDGQCAIDSLPVPVMQFHWVPQSTGDWAAYGATFGYCAAKKQRFYGYRLNLLITLGGVILDFVLMPANADEREAARDMLQTRYGLLALGDKGFVSEPLAKELRERNQIRLLALRRKNQRSKLPKALRLLVARFRQMIETVNSQIDAQFGIEEAYTHSF